MKKSGVANASVHDASGIALSNTSIFPSLIAPAVNYEKMPHAPTFRLGGADNTRARTSTTTPRNALMTASLMLGVALGLLVAFHPVGNEVVGKF